MSSPRAWLWRSAALPLAPLVLAVVMATWLTEAGLSSGRTSADASVRADMTTAVTAVSAEVRRQLDAAPQQTAGTAKTVSLADVPHSDVAPSALVAARDGGQPVLDDTTSPPMIVTPVFSTPTPPVTTAGRRLSLSAYRVLPLALAPVLSSAAPDGGGLSVRGPSRTVLSLPRGAPPGARTFTAPLDLGGQAGWTLKGWLPTKGVTVGMRVLILGLVLTLAGLAALLSSEERRVRRSQQRQEVLERNGALVSGLAPIVQASLDLGEVVPAACAHLAQGLDLTGLSLSAPGPAGERQLFSWGTAPDHTVAPGAVPGSLPAETTFALSLARGGRVLGVLRVTTGRALAATELRALATASELLGSTLANAEAFARQQLVVERMQSVDELKTVFLATASHELRTPVAAIVGFSSLVLEQWGRGDPEQTKAFLERVKSNALALETLTEQLLDFSRLERGIRPAAVEVLDLGVMTSRVLEEHEELTAEHDLRQEVAKDCLVHGSEPALSRIVTNLVGNAAKYSPSGTTITVRVQAEGDRVALVVDDEGPGVPPADRERIFTRFYRGHGEEVNGTRGSGVGLAIVAEFAASMSGTATVQEAPSGGARFRVAFPAAGASSPTLPEGDRHVRLP